jgi:hypothetical protein
MAGWTRRFVVGAAALVVTVPVLGIVTTGISGAATDLDAPVLASLSITPGSVNTEDGPAAVTVEARLTDETSPSIGGRAPLSYVALTGPGGQQRAVAYLSHANRISGGPTDGVYRSTISLPWHAEPGRWAASALLVDTMGNTASLTTANLGGRGVDQTGAGDTTAPQLLALTVAPTTLNTTTASATLSVTARVVDDLAGVSSGTAVSASQVVLRGPTGAHRVRANLGRSSLVGGDALDATFSVQVTVPRWAEQGAWVVEKVTLVDEVGNVREVDAPGIGFTQTGAGDIAPPRVRTFTMSKTTVDVRASAASISLTARITDDFSGVADTGSEASFISPSGNHEVFARFGSSQRVSGNAIDGNYGFVMSVPAHTEPGTWTLRHAYFADRANNALNADAQAWLTAGFPNAFEVVSDAPPEVGPTLPPTTIGPSTTFESGSTTTTTFSGSTTTTTAGSTTTTLGSGETTSTSTSTTALPSTTTTLESTTTTLDPTTTTTPDVSTTVPGSTTPETTDPTTSTTAPDSVSTSTIAVAGTTVPTPTTARPPSTSTPTTKPVQPTGRPVAPKADGYWFATAQGAVSGFGVSAPSSGPVFGGYERAVAVSAGAKGLGYRVASNFGDVRAGGGARSYGSMRGVKLTLPVVGMASTPSGRGYWLVASDGGIFSFGDAKFYGSTGAMRLNQPIVAMASTRTGRGYWLVASDGGIFSFGDARFYGSTGAMHLNKPIVGMASTPTGKGYWLVATDGGIFSFGDAKFYGSTGAMRLNQSIVGMAAAPTGKGYWFVASDGGLFSFGATRFFGSLGSRALPAPVVGIAIRVR